MEAKIRQENDVGAGDEKEDRMRKRTRNKMVWFEWWNCLQDH